MDLTMNDTIKPYRMIKDYVTGMDIAEVGAEGNRQAVERILVLEKGFGREDIEVNAELAFEVAGDRYVSAIDLVVSADGEKNPCMVFKCVPGSFGSCEREIIAAARLLDQRYQVPLAVVSDGVDAVVLDTNTGKKIGEGLTAIPDKVMARKMMESQNLRPCSAARIDRERLIYRTYNCDYVNVAKNLPR